MYNLAKSLVALFLPLSLFLVSACDGEEEPTKKKEDNQEEIIPEEGTNPLNQPPKSINNNEPEHKPVNTQTEIENQIREAEQPKDEKLQATFNELIQVQSEFAGIDTVLTVDELTQVIDSAVQSAQQLSEDKKSKLDKFAKLIAKYNKAIKDGLPGTVTANNIKVLKEEILKGGFVPPKKSVTKKQPSEVKTHNPPPKKPLPPNPTKTGEPGKVGESNIPNPPPLPPVETEEEKQAKEEVKKKAKEKSGGESLLEQIQKFNKKQKLKKTETDDKSAPSIEKKK
jgi:hypothetical protein